MATSRSSIVLLALLCLACTHPQRTEPPPPEIAAITKQRIDHVTPRPDFVGPAPTRLEWTTIDGVDSYNITVITEIDSVVFQHSGARGSAIDWPKEITLEPGTYFWRIVGMTEGRSVADSGRSAFVVSENVDRRR